MTTDAALAANVAATLDDELHRLTEEVRILKIHIAALNATLARRDETIKGLRLELAKYRKDK